MNWKNFLRIVINIVILISIIGNFILATQIGVMLNLGAIASFFVGLLVFSFGVLFTFIFVSIIMVILDAADDIEIIKSYIENSDYNNLSDEQEFGSDAWKCKECGEFNSSDEFVCNECGTYIV